MRWLTLFAAIAVGTAAIPGPAGAKDDKTAKRLLLVTDSGGFIHDSVGLAEQILKEIGPKHGLDVTCFRYTRDPKAPAFAKYAADFRRITGLTVEPENCGRVNAETLAKFDAVLFFTTGDPITKDEAADLLAWVKKGGAFAGTHCATDTLYKTPAYGEIIGAYFVNHPWHQKIKLKVEDPAHPAGKSFPNGAEITDEIYQFGPSKAGADIYSRDRLHIILSLDNSSVDTTKKDVVREDKDFAISWCQKVGEGRSFYTSLGHRKEVWQDPRFQEHLLGGIKWALKQLPGDATPSAQLKKPG